MHGMLDVVSETSDESSYVTVVSTTATKHER
jgi:hypothetical protein